MISRGQYRFQLPRPPLSQFLHGGIQSSLNSRGSGARLDGFLHAIRGDGRLRGAVFDALDHRDQLRILAVGDPPHDAGSQGERKFGRRVVRRRNQTYVGTGVIHYFSAGGIRHKRGLDDRLAGGIGGWLMSNGIDDGLADVGIGGRAAVQGDQSASNGAGKHDHKRGRVFLFHSGFILSWVTVEGMVMKLLLVLAILFLLGCFLWPGCVATKLTNGIPNLVAVDPGQNIWRGGQPTVAGWEWLRSQGVTNVVKLNAESEASDDYARKLGMTVRYYPISLEQQLLFVPPKIVSDAANIIGPGTFVHCEHGQDRTGLVIATYSLKHGLSKADAQTEMLALGFHKELHGLWECWERTE